MLTVACVLSPGPGGYTRAHVERLRGMVARHMVQEHRFVCINDSPFPGWWAKVSLFEPGRFAGRILYLDLDVTVVGPLDDLAGYPQPFAAMKDPLYKGINSSVMVWTPSTDMDRLYTEFTPDVMKRLPGDQDFIMRARSDIAYFPQDWCVSYKHQRFIRLKTIPRDARVICYHGKPKPWGLPLDHLAEFRVV